MNEKRERIFARLDEIEASIKRAREGQKDSNDLDYYWNVIKPLENELEANKMELLK